MQAILVGYTNSAMKEIQYLPWFSECNLLTEAYPRHLASLTDLQIALSACFLPSHGRTLTHIGFALHHPLMQKPTPMSRGVMTELSTRTYLTSKLLSQNPFSHLFLGWLCCARGSLLICQLGCITSFVFPRPGLQSSTLGFNRKHNLPC